MTDLNQLYQSDYATWAEKNAQLLKSGHFSELDIEHLVDELIDMGRSERNELESRLTILLLHLLKWQYQYSSLADLWKEFEGKSWRNSIIEQRDRISKRLHQSPGLRSHYSSILTEAYQDAVRLAVKETGLVKDTFPQQCPYSEEQILDEAYYPEHK